MLTLREIHFYLKPIKWKYFWLAPMAALFLWSAYLQMLYVRETQFDFPYLDNSMKRVYDYLKENGSPQDVAIDFFLGPASDSFIQALSKHKIIFHDSDFHPKIFNLKWLNPKIKHKSAENIGFLLYYINRQRLRGARKIFFVVSNPGHIFFC